MIRRKVTVRVPATSANLGPGYDCLGLAVDLWNELTVEAATSYSMHIEGEGADVLPRNGDNLVVQGVKIAFETAGIEVPELAYFCKNGIPYGSGLGSSSAAIVSGLLAGLVLTGKELPVEGQEELLQLAAKVEGHIDNLGPCIYGALQLGLHNGKRWSTTAISVPVGLQCIVFTPSTPMSTAEARAMLKETIQRDDAVFNLGRMGLLINAFNTNRMQDLQLATEDKLHQPVRGCDKVMPALFPVIDAALKAGASACFLSGAGSSIMALTAGAKGDVYAQCSVERKDKDIAEAMKTVAARHGVKGRVFITRPTTVGAHVVCLSETVTHHPPLGSGMKYVSTRDPISSPISFEDAVMQGLAPDGGLFVPEVIPQVSLQQLKEWQHLAFPELAVRVMSLYIGRHEIPEASLTALTKRSYETFASSHVVPLIEFSEDKSTFLLEQFHGPTCAFKDVALQFVGNLFEYFLQRRNASATADNKHVITVLGATSGDTGSAAIAGLRGKKDVNVFILHPKDRVAPVQEAQMTTVLDENVHNVAVEGAFDDCQTIVKTLFGQKEFRHKYNLAAVNSINWARILAQIVYYFYAYFRWLEMAERSMGDELLFSVPTGNFGNALAGFYARSMGLPIKKLIVSTNTNDILHRFFSASDYSARPVVPSLAPAMDIVIPSNFERYLYHLLGNAILLNECMTSIKATGTFRLPSGDSVQGSEKYWEKIRSTFGSARASDEDISATIADCKEKRRYALCPHSAAGVHGLRSWRAGNPEEGAMSCICFATAHPGKFGNGLREARKFPPALPPQLDGLLDRPTRCLEAPNNCDAVADIVSRTLATKFEPSPSILGRLGGLLPSVQSTLSFAFGVATAVMALRLAKQQT